MAHGGKENFKLLGKGVVFMWKMSLIGIHISNQKEIGVPFIIEFFYALVYVFMN